MKILSKKNLIIAFALIIAAAFFFYKLRSDERKQIIKQMNKLSDIVSISSGEKPVQTMLKMNSLAELFNHECEIEAAHEWINGIYTAEEIASKVARARMNFKTLTLSFYDINVEIKDQKSATANFTAKVSGITRDEKAVDEIREINAELVKKDNKWLFAKFAAVETLKK